jgi:flavodoxin
MSVRIAVIYYSATGNVYDLARAIAALASRRDSQSQRTPTLATADAAR